MDLKKLSLLEYHNIMNKRNVIINKFKSDYEEIAKELRNVLKADSFENKLKIITNTLFKEHFSPMPGRKGYLINGNEYYLLNNENIQCRTYRCHSYSPIQYFGYEYSVNTPTVLEMFSSFPDIYLFFKEMIDILNDIKKKLVLTSEKELNTEKTLDINYISFSTWSTWSSEIVNFESKKITNIRTRIIKEQGGYNYKNNKSFELSEQILTYGYEKEYLIDSEYFHMLSSHCENVIFILKDTIREAKDFLDKYDKILIDSKYGHYLIAAGI